jgi:hypothetical protein
LTLFARTAHEACPQAAAERFILLSRYIAESLELGIASSRDVMLKKDERYVPVVDAWTEREERMTGLDRCSLKQA